jgi:hypothetical protein
MTQTKRFPGEHMAQQVQPGDDSLDFQKLMQHGRMALERGDRQLAHNLWREAAMIDPYNEQVWLALLDVLDTRADQRVCLENILSINPLNTQARRMLRAYTAEDQRQIERRARMKRRMALLRRQRWMLLRRALLLGILLGVTGVIFAVVLSILLYT